MSEPPGYSGRRLVDKLGVKSGFRLKVANAPADYERLLAPLPDGVVISNRLRPPVDLWHLFVDSRSELRRRLPSCCREVRQSGMIWVSWPKRASGVESDVTGDAVRELALPLGLVDVKVCAVDDTWSGLKLVIRKENRNGRSTQASPRHRRA